MTRPVINDLFWIVGLLLQCGLVALVFLRGLARRLPAFATLVAFYTLRSAALFALFGHVSNETYAAIYDVLSILDLLLQLLVAAEIAVALVRAAGGWSSRFGRLLLMLPVIAIAATLGLSRILPSNTQVRPDRMQLFDWLVLILLGLATLTQTRAARRISERPRLLAQGFALYSVTGLCVTVARTFAALHHDAHRLAEWSYTLPTAWIVVVLYWISALKRPIPSASQSAETGVAAPA